MTQVFIGIDPGTSSGAAAAIDENAQFVGIIRLDRGYDELAKWIQFRQDMAGGKVSIALERVAAARGRHDQLDEKGEKRRQGVSSTFKFGKSAGLCEGVLIGLFLDYEFPSPLKWQNALDCRTGGSKKVSQQNVQKIFDMKVAQRDADAVLIAEYCRRLKLGLL